MNIDKIGLYKAVLSGSTPFAIEAFSDKAGSLVVTDSKKCSACKKTLTHLYQYVDPFKSNGLVHPYQ